MGLKNKSIDKKLVALKQRYEINYISIRYEIPKNIVTETVKEFGRSRKKVYAALREKGFTI